MRCEGASYLISKKATEVGGKGTKVPRLQDAHQDFSEPRITNMAHKLSRDILSLTVLLALDHGASCIMYHPDNTLRRTTPPVRILLPNAGDVS